MSLKLSATLSTHTTIFLRFCSLKLITIYRGGDCCSAFTNHEWFHVKVDGLEDGCSWRGCGWSVEAPSATFGLLKRRRFCLRVSERMNPSESVSSALVSLAGLHCWIVTHTVGLLPAVVGEAPACCWRAIVMLLRCCARGGQMTSFLEFPLFTTDDSVCTADCRLWTVVSILLNLLTTYLKSPSSNLTCLYYQSHNEVDIVEMLIHQVAE